jgi:ATP-binding cassette, subfamily G (WHITE), member 2, SNQ2
MAASITAESILGKEIHEDQMSDSTNTVAVEPIALSVKRFLSPYHADDVGPQPTAIVMKNLTIEGSGTGVSNASSSKHI